MLGGTPNFLVIQLAFDGKLLLKTLLLYGLLLAVAGCHPLDLLLKGFHLNGGRVKFCVKLMHGNAFALL